MGCASPSPCSVSKYLDFGILLKIKLNTLEMWPFSGMSLQIIFFFGKIIHRTIELDMSSLVKVPVFTDQETERSKCYAQIH